jgi:hypothetical protein
MHLVSGRKGERGQTIALLALSIVVLLIFAAFAIDTGVLYTARTSAQTAADAAALAGVYTFMDPCTAAAPPATCAVATPQPTAAQNAAKAIAAKNSIMGQPVNLNDTFTDCTTLPTTFSAGSQGAVCVDAANKRVTVAVSRQGSNGVGTFFARVISRNLVNVSGHATAEAGPGATGSRCLKPVFLPNTILSTSGQNGCNLNPKEIIFNPSNSGQLTPWAQSKVGQCVNMRPTQANDKNALPAAGQFYSLDFGSGGSTYECAWENCLTTPSCKTNFTSVQCGSQYPLETGDMVGPLQHGVDGLIGKPPTDSWVGLGDYSTPQGYSTNSKALIIAPIWDNCAQQITSGTKGQQVQVLGFVELFVDQATNQPVAGCLGGSGGGNGNSGTWVEAHLVSQIQCSIAAGNGGPTSTGPLGVPLRLVQTP